MNDTEDHTKGMNGENIMVTTDTQHQNKDDESHNTGLGKIDNRHSGTETRQHTLGTC